MDSIRDLRGDILLRADRLFYGHGIHAVGINRLIAESGVAKDTFYRYFRSKESLIAAYLDARHAASAHRFRTLTEGINDPRSRLRTVFEDLVRRLDRDGYRGCAFMMAMAEYGHVPALAAIIRHHKDWMRGEIEAICSEISPGSEEVARHLSLLYEGFVARWSVSAQADDKTALLSAVDRLILDLA